MKNTLKAARLMGLIVCIINGASAWAMQEIKGNETEQYQTLHEVKFQWKNEDQKINGKLIKDHDHWSRWVQNEIKNEWTLKEVSEKSNSTESTVCAIQNKLDRMETFRAEGIILSFPVTVEVVRCLKKEEMEQLKKQVCVQWKDEKQGVPWNMGWGECQEE